MVIKFWTHTFDFYIKRVAEAILVRSITVYRKFNVSFLMHFQCQYAAHQTRPYDTHNRLLQCNTIHFLVHFVDCLAVLSVRLYTNGCLDVS